MYLYVWQKHQFASYHKTLPRSVYCLLLTIIQYLSKKGCEFVAILRDYFVKTKLQTHRDCIIAKFANSVNAYVHTYSHRSCAYFVNFTNVSTWIARTLHEHTFLASLREVFACVLLPFFLTCTVCHQRCCRYLVSHGLNARSVPFYQHGMGPSDWAFKIITASMYNQGRIELRSDERAYNSNRPNSIVKYLLLLLKTNIN